MKFLLLFTCSLLLLQARSQKPVLVGDCTVVYSITGGNTATNNNLSGATKVLMIKGNMSRVDVSSSNYKQSIITANKSGSVIILKEIGNEKYMSTLTPEQWENQNKQFDGMTISFSGDTKTILGYECKKAMARLKNGTSYIIYYATAIVASVSENPYEFKDIPGFILEYETIGNNNSSKITYTATEINFNPVPAYKFEIPSSGYRILK